MVKMPAYQKSEQGTYILISFTDYKVVWILEINDEMFWYKFQVCRGLISAIFNVVEAAVNFWKRLSHDFWYKYEVLKFVDLFVYLVLNFCISNTNVWEMFFADAF